jgi:hypothetical protein
MVKHGLKSINANKKRWEVYIKKNIKGTEHVV